MHIVIATVGTRGDAQPYVALGAELLRRGHRVTMATHEDHRALAEAHGLGFRAVCGSFRALLDSPEGIAWLESSASPSQYLKTLRALFVPLVPSWLDEFDQALDDCDAALVHSFAMGATVVAKRRKLPFAVISPFSVVPTGQQQPLGLPAVPLLGPWLEKTLFTMFMDKAWGIGQDAVAQYLARFGEPMPRGSYRQLLLDSGVGHLHLVSPAVFPRPTDWPSCAEVTGYCFLDAHPDWTPSAKLEEFLAAGEPPVYVGFGSMTGMDPAALAALTREAIHRAKRRAVVAMGWGGMRGFEGSDELLVVEDVPHDWLFPRVSAVVHHAGAGTTAAALRAGKPSVGVPFFGDQPWWASALARHGVAPPPIAKQKLTAERLATAIVAATTNEAFRTRAEEMGAQIRAERGAAVAADRALHYLGAS